MKSPEFSSVFPNSNRTERVSSELSEEQAEKRLEQLLKDSDNAFLTQVPQNQAAIENAPTFKEAVAFAEAKIRARLIGSLEVREVHGDHSDRIEVNPDAVLNTLESIRGHAVDIGEGADARVVVDTTDIVSINPEVCYKLALPEKSHRGRNSIVEEVDLQGAFFEASKKIATRHIGVPMPYYEVSVASAELIAMEKLHARSVDDILRGIGSLPKWFDADVFCDALEDFVATMHTEHLYHRDLHFGNIMISQHIERVEGEPMGYVIDFGLSGYGHEGFEPYKKEVAGTTFTYDDDRVRIPSLRKALKTLQVKQNKG